MRFTSQLRQAYPSQLIPAADTTELKPFFGDFQFPVDSIVVHMYHCTPFKIKRETTMAFSKKKATTAARSEERILVERIQTGVRLEKRLLKVLKGLAEYHDMTLGDLLEGIVLHAFDGKHPFSEDTRQRIADLKRIYKLDLNADASHRLLEVKNSDAQPSGKRGRQERTR